MRKTRLNSKKLWYELSQSDLTPFKVFMDRKTWQELKKYILDEKHKWIARYLHQEEHYIRTILLAKMLELEKKYEKGEDGQT